MRGTLVKSVVLVCGIGGSVGFAAVPVEENPLSMTWLGRVDGAEMASVALSWTGGEPTEVTLWDDIDGDGLHGPGEPVAATTTSKNGVAVVEVDPDLPPERLRAAPRGGKSVKSGSYCWWESGFGIGDLSGIVHALAVWDDGSGPALYVGGEFTTAGLVAANRIAKWDGTSWSALAGGVNKRVRTISIYDGRLIVGGDFDEADGVPMNYIAAWDGADWAALGSGVDAWVNALTVYDGELIAGGAFGFSGGSWVGRIAAWDGTSWSALGSGMSAGVNALTIFDGKLVAGGGFTFAGGVPAKYIAGWDGSSWSTFGAGHPSSVSVLTVYSGDLVATGGPWFGIRVWDGATWSQLPGYSSPSTETAMAVHDGILVVAGAGINLGGTPANHIASWDGASWSTLGDGTNAGVLALTVFDGDLVAGGFFETAGGVAAHRVASWDGADWAALQTMGNGMSNLVRAMTIYDGKLIAGGDFVTAGGVPVNRIAAWDGTNWSPLGDGFVHSVNALTVWDGKLIAGGVFGPWGGSPFAYIASWDGSTWSSLGGLNNMVVALGSYDGELLVAGTFTNVGSGGLATWNGLNWSNHLGSVSGIQAFTIFDGELVAGGTFTTAGGVPANRIASWDGATWAPLDSGMNNAVYAFAEYGGELVAGGVFSTAGGVAASRVASWDGADWSPLGTGVSGGSYQRVQALAVYDNKLVASGGFTGAGGSPADNIASWDGSGWAPYDGGTNHEVNALQVFDDRLYLGGEFTVAGGMTAGRIAEYVCIPDEIPPTDPTVDPTSPISGAWASDNTVDVFWSGAFDEVNGSGLDGYSVLFDQSPATQPDETVDIPHTSDPHSVTSGALADAPDWYFHLSTCDRALNCTATVHAGPFLIDITPPTTPGAVSSPSHGGGPASDSTIDVSWGAASDATSGVALYRFDFSASASPPACGTLASTTATTSISSPALADGPWYLHVCAQDAAANTGTVISGGPYVVDTIPPTGLALGSPSHTVAVWSADASVDLVFSGATDPNGVVGYSVVFNQIAMTEPDAVVDQTGVNFTGAASPDAADWHGHVRACDVAGNCSATIHLGAFWIDTTEPVDPGLGSPSHPADGWVVETELDLTWSGAADVGSGLDGYSWLVDQQPATLPDEVVDTPHGSDPHSLSTTISEGGGWYAHLRTCDQLGQCTTTVHHGPMGVDLTGPSASSALTSPSHTLSEPSNDDTVDVDWTASSDPLSGVAGYAWEFDDQTTWSCDGSADGDDPSATSQSLGSGEWWFHVCAVDAAGNLSGVANLGPFVIDLDAPTVALVDTIGTTSDGELTEHESVLAPVTQIVFAFSEAMDVTSLTEPSSWLIVAAGADGTIETVDCGPVVGTDMELAIADVLALGDHTAALRPESDFALAAGSYAALACELLSDAPGNPLDGAADGAPGGDFIRRFQTGLVDLAANPNFDTGSERWSLTPGGGAEWAWTAVADAEGSGASGSLEVAASGTGTARAAQCLDLALGETLFVDVAADLSAESALQVELRFTDQEDCVNLDPSPTTALSIASPTTGWERFSGRAVTPPGAQSAEIVILAEATASGATIWVDRVVIDETFLFADDFESGDTGGWSGGVGERAVAVTHRP